MCERYIKYEQVAGFELLTVGNSWIGSIWVETLVSVPDRTVPHSVYLKNNLYTYQYAATTAAICIYLVKRPSLNIFMCFAQTTHLHMINLSR